MRLVDLVTRRMAYPCCKTATSPASFRAKMASCSAQSAWFWFGQWPLRRLAGLRLRGRPCISSNRNMVNKMGDAYQDGIVGIACSDKSLEDLEADLKLFSNYRPMEPVPLFGT